MTQRTTPYGLGAYSISRLHKAEYYDVRGDDGKFSESGGSGGGAKEKPAPKKPKKEAKPSASEAQAANVASVGEVLNANDDERLGANGLNQLTAFADGKALTPEMEAGLVKVGLVKLDADGVATLTAEGRAVVTAAKKGDADAVGAALDNAGKRVNAAAGRQAAADAKAKEKSDAEAKAKADAEAKAKEKEKKKGGGGGGGGGAKPAEEEKEKADPKAKALAANRQKVVDAMADADEGLSPSGAKALLGFADGGKIDGEQAKGLAAMGLVEIDSKGGARLSAEGRAAAAAMSRGDTRGALDAISRAGDKAPKVAPPKPPEKKDPEFTRARKAVALPYGVGAYTIAKHGSHNQKTHGRATARRKAGRKEYAAARAQGADVATARQRAKDAGAARVAERDARAGRMKASKEQRAAQAARRSPRDEALNAARQDAARATVVRTEAMPNGNAMVTLRNPDGTGGAHVVRRNPDGGYSPVDRVRMKDEGRSLSSPVFSERSFSTPEEAAREGAANALVAAGDTRRLRGTNEQAQLERDIDGRRGLGKRLAKRAPSPLSAYAPISKADEGERLVYGVASTSIVDDQPGVWEGRRYDGDLVEPDAMREALANYWGNLRAMHEGAAGRTLDVTVADDGNTYLVAKVTDDAAWKSVRERVYQGFSIGGRVLKAHLERVGGRLVRRITKLLLTEISLVDRPANPQAAILVYKRHPQGGDMADENETITTPPGEEGADLDALAALAGDDALAKAADPKRVISQIQELRNAAELEGDLEAAERYTQAIGLLLIADGTADEGDIDEDLAEEEEEAGVDLEALGAGEGDEEPAEAAKVLKAGRKIAASRMALLKSALMTYAKALADAGDEDAAKMLKALSPSDEPAADAETMKALVADELKKALGPADSGLQTVARAVLALGDQLKAVAGDVAKIAAQPVGGGPAIRLAPALAKRLGAEAETVTKRADPDPTRQRAIYALEQRLATESNPTTRAQYQAELRKLLGE